MRATIKYPGSKWNIANWIIDHFPKHHSYLEPFFGSGAVLFNKPLSPIETINDLDGDVVNYFRCIREDPYRFARMVYFTAYARKEYDDSVNVIKEPINTALIPDYERATAFAAKMMMGFGFRTNEFASGFKRDIQGRETNYAAADWCSLPNRIVRIADRLRGVQIENRPAVQLIREFKYEKVLIYADPPYLISSRSYKLGMYRYEMTDQDHVDLLQVLKDHPGPVIISGYQNELYDDMLQDWRKEKIECRTQSNGRSTEVIWMNYDLPWIQPSLFEFASPEAM